jgi:hypothetical protein
MVEHIEMEFTPTVMEFDLNNTGAAQNCASYPTVAGIDDNSSDISLYYNAIALTNY